MSESIQRQHTSARSSQIVRCGNLVFLSGHTSGSSGAKDITEQTRILLAEIDALLTEAGTDRNRLLSATIYLRNMSDYAAMNAVWDAWIPSGTAPARTTTGCADLAAPYWLIEMTVIATI